MYLHFFPSSHFGKKKIHNRLHLLFFRYNFQTIYPLFGSIFFLNSQKILLCFSIHTLLLYKSFSQTFFFSSSRHSFTYSLFSRSLICGYEFCILYFCCLHPHPHTHSHISHKSIQFRIVYIYHQSKKKNVVIIIKSKKRKILFANSTYTLHCHKKCTICFFFFLCCFIQFFIFLFFSFPRLTPISTKLLLMAVNYSQFDHQIISFFSVLCSRFELYINCLYILFSI